MDDSVPVFSESEEIQKHYDEYSKQMALSSTNSIDNKFIYEAQWNKAKVRGTKYENKVLVEVPILKKIKKGTNSIVLLDNSNYISLLSYRNFDNKFSQDMIEVIHTGQVPKDDEIGINGYLKVRDLTGNIRVGFHYVKGKVVNILSSFSDKGAKKKGSMGEECRAMRTIYLSAGCVSGSNAEVTIVGTQVTIEADEFFDLSSVPSPNYPGHCLGWSVVATDHFHACHYIPDSGNSDGTPPRDTPTNPAAIPGAYAGAYGSGRPGRDPYYATDDRCHFASTIWTYSSHHNKENFGVRTALGEYLITQELGFSGGSIDGLYKAVDAYGNPALYYYWPRLEPTTGVGGAVPTRLGGENVWIVEIKATIHTHTPCLQDGTDGVSHEVGADDRALAAYAPFVRHFAIGCNGAVAQFNASPAFFNKSGSCVTLWSDPSVKQQ